VKRVCGQGCILQRAQSIFPKKDFQQVRATGNLRRAACSRRRAQPALLGNPSFPRRRESRKVIATKTGFPPPRE
jgi:hypothetical protein